MTSESTATPAQQIAAGYTTTGAALELGSVVVDGVVDPAAQIRIPLAMMNRHGLVAGATGTGKTKTCIALIYRLLKAKRFRRILFLVDRSALGEQAANAFKDTRMERLQTFADIFGIKELEDQAPDDDTAVHLATVQGMVQRVLYPSDGDAPPRGAKRWCEGLKASRRGCHTAFRHTRGGVWRGLGSGAWWPRHWVRSAAVFWPAAFPCCGRSR